MDNDQHRERRVRLLAVKNQERWQKENYSHMEANIIYGSRILIPGVSQDEKCFIESGYLSAVSKERDNFTSTAA